MVRPIEKMMSVQTARTRGTCKLSVPVVIVWAAPPGDSCRMDDLEHLHVLLHLHCWVRIVWTRRINHCLLHGLWWWLDYRYSSLLLLTLIELLVLVKMVVSGSWN